jgi:hypothetical protein
VSRHANFRDMNVAPLLAPAERTAIKKAFPKLDDEACDLINQELTRFFRWRDTVQFSKMTSPEAYKRLEKGLLAAVRLLAAQEPTALLLATLDGKVMSARKRALNDLSKLIVACRSRQQKLFFRGGIAHEPKFDEWGGWPSLLAGLAKIWTDAGGFISGHANDEAGGPFVRFLRMATAPALERPATSAQAKHWIAKLKMRGTDVAE